MASVDNHFLSIHFVDFADRYAVDGYLLGKHIRIRYSDNSILSIVIPSVVNEKGYLSLSIPGLFAKYDVDLDSWGKINGYQSIEKLESIDAWISSVLVECYEFNPINRISADEIQELAIRLLHVLQVIKPEAIRTPSDDLISGICDVKTTVSLDIDGKPSPNIIICSVIDDRTEKFSFKDLKKAILNLNKSISASYELLDNARVNLKHNDTRAAILNCATSIEITLKRKLTEYLVSSSVPSVLKDYVLERADGFSRQIEFCKRFSVSLSGMNNIQDCVINPRNRVIHGGYNPSYQEASKAYNLTRETLIALGIPMFE